MVLANLSDHPAIVLAAYICVFVPWTAVASLDFVSAQWKTVRDTRHDAQYHLFFILAPALYIMFYIAVQLAAQDYKEMAAAIVALIFSLHHVARTVWAIVQLAAFRDWAARAILALREHGVSYQSHCHPQHRDAWQIADCLLVNEDVVDNQLIHGTPRCYLKYRHIDFRLKNDPHLRGPSRIFSRLVTRMRNLVSILLVPPCMLLAASLPTSLSEKLGLTGSLRAVPHEPVDLWLTWASVFAGQGLSDWISDFSVAADEHSLPDKCGLVDSFATRRNYFAGEVLASAIMHSTPPTSTSDAHTYPNPFSLMQWNQHSDTAHDRLTKQDLLSQALSDGRALPFREQHLLARDSEGLFSYRNYAIKLQRVTEGMPNMFDMSILDFDVEKLEWLLILIHIGIFSMEARTTPLEDARSVHGGKGAGDGAGDGDNMQGKLDTGDLAIRNLSTQLGFDNYLGKSSDTSILSVASSFPFSPAHFALPSSNNKLVLHCAEFVDAWLALVAGDDVLYLQEHDSHWMGVYTPEEPREWHLEQNGFYHSFPNLREYHKALEIRRIDFQFSQIRHRHRHLENSLTFMGVSMELVRTFLARWVSTNEDHSSFEWPIYSDGNGGRAKPIDVGSLSDHLSMELDFTDSGNISLDKQLQVHLLVEIQTLCQVYCLSESPDPSVLMMLAITSFPSIRMDAVIGHGPGLTPNSQSCAIQMGPSSSTEERQLCLKFLPCGSPQDLYVTATIAMGAESHPLGKVSLEIGSRDDVTNRHFNWSVWRDSFVARLEGHAQWQVDHSLSTTSVHWTSNSISDRIGIVPTPMSGTGSSFRTWLGWQPFRPEICRFELESSKFLIQTKAVKSYFSEYYSWLNDDRTVGHLPYLERAETLYSTANREVLRHACLIVKEKVPNFDSQDIEQGVSANQNLHFNILLKQADLYLSGKHDGFERAIFLLEIGAAELGSLRALEKCTDLILGSKKLPSRAARATSILNRYLSHVERRPCSTVQQMDERMVALTAIIPIFQRVVDCDDLSTSVLPHFVRFVTMIPSFISSQKRVEQLSCQLRRAFVHCLDVQLISNLAQIAFRKQRTWCSLPGGYVRQSVDIHGRPQGVVNIRKKCKYIAWVEESGNNLKRRYLERASEEEKSVDCFLDLAHFLRLGPSGTTKDWERAVNLYTESLNISVRPDALYFLGVILKDGGHGADQNRDKALDYFDRAIAEGYRDKPFVAASIVRLQSENCTADERKAIMVKMNELVEESKSAMALYSMAFILQFGQFGVPCDIERSRELYMRAMELGDLDASRRLIEYFYEEGENVDLAKAAELNCRAIVENQDTIGMFALGRMLKLGHGVQQNSPLALEAFETGMLAGNEQCAASYVDLLVTGAKGVPVDIQRTIETCRSSLRLKSSYEMSRALSSALVRSDNAEDIEEGFELMNVNIAEHMDIKAMFHVALCMKNGTHPRGVDSKRSHELFSAIVKTVSLIDHIVEEDISNPLYSLSKWHNDQHEISIQVSWSRILDFYEAVEIGVYVNSLLAMATNLYEGNGVIQDMEMSRKLYKTALRWAKWSPHVCKFVLGEASLQGRYGLPKDIRLGMELMTAAAETGPEEFKLSCSYVLLSPGDDVEPNWEKGILLLEEVIAAVEGNLTIVQCTACRILARILKSGDEGPEKDLVRARELLELAIEKGQDQQSMLTLAGTLYLGSDGFEKDEEAGLRMYEMCMETNSDARLRLQAQYFSAVILCEMKRSFEDLKRGISIYRRIVSEHGYTGFYEVEARVQLARLALSGQGGAEGNAYTAVQILEEILIHCEEDALTTNCRCLLAGILLLGPAGVSPSPERALKLMQKVKELGGEPSNVFICSASLSDGLGDLVEIGSEWKFDTCRKELPQHDGIALYVQVQLIT